MEREEVLNTLYRYINERVLGSESRGVEADSPLLEWGVLNSFETVRLMRFIREELKVEVPPARMRAAELRTLETITELVLSCAEDAAR